MKFTELKLDDQLLEAISYLGFDTATPVQEQVIPIINPPQCAIIAVGSIEKEVVVDDNDQFQTQRRMWLSLVFDHRIIDGAPAGKFISELKRILEWPLLLVE